MLAIPVFRARIAPVLDWCSKIIIVPEEGSDAASRRQIDVMKGNIFRLIRTLREQGIKTLICGALSPELLNYVESIDLRIIHGIAGDIEEVLQAYREQKLDQPNIGFPVATDNAGTGATRPAPRMISMKRNGKSSEAREKALPATGKRRVTAFAPFAAPGHGMSGEFPACRFTAPRAADQ